MQNILFNNIVNDKNYIVYDFYPFSIVKTWLTNLRLSGEVFVGDIRIYSLVEARIESSTRLINYFNKSKNVKNKEVKIKKHQDIIKNLINAYCDELI